MKAAPSQTFAKTNRRMQQCKAQSWRPSFLLPVFLLSQTPPLLLSYHLCLCFSVNIAWNLMDLPICRRKCFITQERALILSVLYFMNLHKLRMIHFFHCRQQNCCENITSISYQCNYTRNFSCVFAVYITCYLVYQKVFFFLVGTPQMLAHQLQQLLDA